MVTENLFHCVIKRNESTGLSVLTTLVAELYAEVSKSYVLQVTSGPVFSRQIHCY